MDKNLLKKRHTMRVNSLSEQSSEDKAFFMSAPDIMVYFDHQENQQAVKRKQSQTDLPNEPLDSWVLLVACIAYNMIMGYHFLCFGMYYVKITETFETSKAAAGFINSLHGAVGPLSGLVASALIEKYGERRVSIIGSCLTVTGVFSSVFAPNVYYLYFTYGAVTGLGVSSSMLGLSVSIQKHFNKHRSLATSLVYCGIPFGNLFSPMITNSFLSTYGLRGTLLLHSGIMLNTVVLSGTFWPAKPKQRRGDGTETNRSLKAGQSVNKSGLCDFSLCRNIPFIMLISSVVLIRFNTATFMDHTPSRTVHLGYDLKWAGFLMTVLCISSLTSRLVCSVVTIFLQQINSLLIYAICGSIQAVTSCLVPLASSSYYRLLICSVTFGASQGLLIPMLMLSTVQLAGVNKFGKARALTNLFSALANLTATPVSGWIFDMTQNYDLPFYISGSVALTGCTIAYITAVTHHCKSSGQNDTVKQTERLTKYDRNDSRIRTFTY